MSDIKKGATIWARTILLNSMYTDKPSTWFKLFFYIVNSVNTEDEGILKRGQGFFNWMQLVRESTLGPDITYGTIDACIRWMRKEGLITTQRLKYGMVITVTEFNEFEFIAKLTKTFPNETGILPEAQDNKLDVNAPVLTNETGNSYKRNWNALTNETGNSTKEDIEAQQNSLFEEEESLTKQRPNETENEFDTKLDSKNDLYINNNINNNININNKYINNNNNNKISNKYCLISDLSEKDFQEIADKYHVPLAFVISKYDDMMIWAGQPRNNKKTRGRNWRLTLMNWVKRDALKITQQHYGKSKIAHIE